MQITKNLHGSISLDTIYYQNIDRQRIWFTIIDDQWGTLSDDDRK